MYSIILNILHVLKLEGNSIIWFMFLCNLFFSNNITFVRFIHIDVCSSRSEVSRLFWKREIINILNFVG